MDTDHWLTSKVDAEEPIRAYGATASNASPTGKIRNQEDVDIQLYDFKGVNFKDPLIPQSHSVPINEERKPAQRPTSLLSSQSSDHHSVAYSDTSFNQHDSWLRHPKVRENWKIVLASAFLSVLGIALVLSGIILAFTPARGWHCLIFCFIGLLCVIPGGYHFVYIYCAALGRPGYQFENLPVLR
ncbi:transmembrane protein 134 isoform X2 [Aplysia californica]|uniref:Transmembrane protein 134 isoform X2 n=1 Tax=Aplysia californica TaxID=6500 RepID=A0ABM0K4L0_APLCA|nr:transmembrane protein 134 isoform X2 [Aplysia californica]